MAKKWWLIVGVVLVLVIALNFFAFYNGDNQNLSGMFSMDFFGSSDKINISVIIFALQWIVLLIVGIIIYFKFIKKRREEKNKMQSVFIRKKKFDAETDFDTLYELLKEKKSLSIGAISKLLKIKKEMVLTWIKILENNELVTIDYPIFGDPQVSIKTKKGDVAIENVPPCKKNKKNIENKKIKDIGKIKKKGEKFGFFKKKNKEKDLKNNFWGTKGDVKKIIKRNKKKNGLKIEKKLTNGNILKKNKNGAKK